MRDTSMKAVENINNHPQLKGFNISDVELINGELFITSEYELNEYHEEVITSILANNSN
jgi:hypothetical protein